MKRIIFTFLSFFLFFSKISADETQDVLTPLTGKTTSNIRGYNIDLTFGDKTISGVVTENLNRYSITLQIDKSKYVGQIIRKPYGIFKKWFYYYYEFKKGDLKISGSIEQEYKKFSTIDYIAMVRFKFGEKKTSGTITSKGDRHLYLLKQKQDSITGTYNLNDNSFDMNIYNKKVVGRFNEKIKGNTLSFSAGALSDDEIFLFLSFYFYETLEIHAQEQYSDENIDSDF